MRDSSTKIAKAMRFYLSREDCPFPRQLLQFGILAFSEMQQRGMTVVEFQQSYLAEFQQHVIPNAFYYYAFFGLDLWPARRRIAEILDLKPAYEAALQEHVNTVRQQLIHLMSLSVTQVPARSC